MKLLEQSPYADLLTPPEHTIFSVGSVLHRARDGDVIWGTGRNGKVPPERHCFTAIDVRAVRGPLTADFLRQKGINCPHIYGDPALLLPHLFPKFLEIKKCREALFVPNYNDHNLIKSSLPEMSPRKSLWRAIKMIAESEFVAGSSLHSIIVADALGIESRFVQSHGEDDFKYIDYLRGTGRDRFAPADSPEEALRLGGQEKASFDAHALMDSFPYDAFRKN